MRSPCPIANTLDILGDKWTLLVIRDLFAGKSTYSEFQSSPEKIPTNILANRLKRLTENGIILKTPYQERPVRYAYRLTDKGLSLGPVLREMANWGVNNIAATKAQIKMNL
ncbi:MAG: helix-turn-helix transcriptional regulator [Gammaproteobacteria bacterium]|nr:helix-turn-helix transcriptional regulator [Gammaproteobacteria bacterium]